LVDLANVGYKDDPWVLAERVTQVFYIADPMNVKKHIVVSRKQRILRVEGVIDVEGYNQFEELVLFKDHEKRIQKIEV
jgi:dihydrofolate reductase